MTAYFGWSVHPTASTLSSKVDDNQTQWYSTRTFPSPASKHNFFFFFFHLQAQKDNSQPSKRRRAFSNAGQKYERDAAGKWRSDAAGRPREPGFSSTPRSNRHFSKPSFWDSTQHNLLLGFVLVKRPGKIKHFYVLHESCVTWPESPEGVELKLCWHYDQGKKKYVKRKCIYDPEMEHGRVELVLRLRRDVEPHVISSVVHLQTCLKSTSEWSLLKLPWQLLQDQAAECVWDTQGKWQTWRSRAAECVCVCVWVHSALPPPALLCPTDAQVSCGSPSSRWQQAAQWHPKIMSAASGWRWPGWGRRCSSPGWPRSLATPSTGTDPNLPKTLDR